MLSSGFAPDRRELQSRKLAFYGNRIHICDFVDRRTTIVLRRRAASQNRTETLPRYE